MDRLQPRRDHFRPNYSQYSGRRMPPCHYNVGEPGNDLAILELTRNRHQWWAVDGIFIFFHASRVIAAPPPSTLHLAQIIIAVTDGPAGFSESIYSVSTLLNDPGGGGGGSGGADGRVATDVLRSRWRRPASGGY